ncbi:hypothetical protein FRB94_013079 [Tulasnella sp. JGI-2019a]|nr:hypothetical protein FRB93_001842 [Tulasnella sp. JGI-2019a]KAG9008672.1 hypothetical protein FRB94_013079 [Tulasnella sp. JGI-2019a]KAG9033864.1 hypothetical protein FRB95_014186 [Tulasnella sp. JGI-2019a]
MATHTPYNSLLPIDEAEQKIALLEGKVRLVNDRMAYLHHAAYANNTYRNRLLTTIAFLKNTRAIISHLPVEILGMIFVEYFAINDDGRGLQFMKLCRVCRSWKDIMQATPQLWTRITFTADGSFPRAMIPTWLRRSGSCPLDLKIRFGVVGFTIQQTAEEWEALIETVYNIFSHRQWRSLNVQVYGDGVPYTVINPFIHHLHLKQSPNILEHITIDVRNRHNRPSVSLPVEATRILADAMEASTSLASYNLPTGLASMLGQSTLSKVTSLCLTSLQADFPSLPKALPLLNNSSALRSLSLLGNGWHPTEFNVLSFPSLESLSITSWNNLTGLFSELRVPKLRSLIVDTITGYRSTTDTVAAFRKLLLPGTGSPPPLTSLTLNAVPFTEKQLVWTLERLSTLEKLKVTHTTKLTDILFNALAKEPDVGSRSRAQRSWLCPNLRVLEVGEGCKYASEVSFGWVVQRRVLEVPAVVNEVQREERSVVDRAHRRPLETVIWKGQDAIKQKEVSVPRALMVQWQLPLGLDAF